MYCSLLLVFILVNLLGYSVNVYADSSVTITVTAEVEPTAYILVNNSDKVQKIISNSATPVRFFSYKNSLKGQEVALSSDIMGQYDKITDNGRTCHSGVVYQLEKPSSTGLTMKPLSMVSLLFRP